MRSRTGSGPNISDAASCQWPRRGVSAKQKRDASVPKQRKASFLAAMAPAAVWVPQFSFRFLIHVFHGLERRLEAGCWRSALPWPAAGPLRHDPPRFGSTARAPGQLYGDGESQRQTTTARSPGRRTPYYRLGNRGPTAQRSRHQVLCLGTHRTNRAAARGSILFTTAAELLGDDVVIVDRLFTLFRGWALGIAAMLQARLMRGAAFEDERFRARESRPQSVLNLAAI